MSKAINKLSTNELYGFKLKVKILEIVSVSLESLTIPELEEGLLEFYNIESFQKKAFRQRLYNSVRSLEKQNFVVVETKMTRLKTEYILVSVGVASNA